MSTLASFAIAAGAWIFAAFIVLWLIAIAHGYYTRRGSAINQRTYGDTDAPGAKAPSVLSHDRSAARRLIMGARRAARSRSTGEQRRRPAGRRGRATARGSGSTSRRRA
jgi:hypothetical protein